ncbi:MAG: hypothetical protein IJN39_00245, partial [Clostridia bacterium]|nr:hypothetical protein [Clostridia bacterium]
MKKTISLICVFVLMCQLFIPAVQADATYTYESQLAFPSYGQENVTADVVATLSGDGVEVSFKKIKASDGKYYVQRQTTVDGSIVDDYTDGLGFLIMYASSTTPYYWYNGTNENYPHLIGSYGSYSFNTGNVFAGGYPSWVTMSDISVSNGVVTMSGENDFASVSASWSMASTDKDPKVDLTVTVKQNGYYSFGMFTSPKGFLKDTMKFIQVPYRYNEKGLPDDSYLVSEAYSTASVSQVTTNTGTKVSGKDVTYG